MNNLIELLNAQRISQNEVKVSYKHNETGNVFSVFWNNIHEGTGDIVDYDLQIDCESDNKELEQKVIEAVTAREDSHLYLEIIERYNSNDCELE